MGTAALLTIALVAILVLLVLVIKFEFSAYASLLLVAMGTALVAGIPVDQVVPVMIAGMGKVLGSVAIIVGLGSMPGRGVVGHRDLAADLGAERLDARRADRRLKFGDKLIDRGKLDLEIVAHRGVRGGHQRAERDKIARRHRIGGGECAGVFGDDVAPPLEGDSINACSDLIKHVRANAAQRLNAHGRSASFACCPTFCVAAVGVRVLDVSVDHEQAQALLIEGKWDQLSLHRLAVEAYRIASASKD